MAVETNKNPLKKQLGVVNAVSLIAGTIIGSGIFLTPNDTVAQVGSYGMALMVWLVAGIVVLMASLCYAELGTAVPESGGEYTYLRHCFGGLPAFLYAWMSVFATWPMSGGIILITCARYLTRPFFSIDCEPPTYTVKMAALGLLVFLTVINCMSTRWSANLTSLLFFTKLIALVSIILIGIVSLSQGNVSHLQHSFRNTSVQAGSLVVGLYDSFWAYAGWNNANYVTGELKSPKVLPLALMIAVPLVVVCYMLVYVAYMSILPRALFVKSEAIAVDAAQHILGDTGLVLMPLLVALSCIGAANGSLFAGARVYAESAKRGDIPKVFGLIHYNMGTPFTGVLLQAVFAAFYILVVDIGTLLQLFSFLAWTFYGAAIVALIVLRYREPDLPRVIKVPLVIPIFVVLVAAFLVITPFYQYPVQSSLALAFMILGTLVYFIFVTRRLLKPLHSSFDKASDWTVRTVQYFVNAD